MAEQRQAEHEQSLQTRRIYDGQILSLRIDTVRMPSGRLSSREVVEHNGAVVVLPIDSEGRVLAVRQFRHPAQRPLLELPAGTREAGEDADVCAARELREETGFSAGRLERLGGFYASPGYCTEYLEAFLATELEPSPLESGDEEGLRTEAVPLEDFLDRAARGEIEDAKSLAALLLYIRRPPPAQD